MTLTDPQGSDDRERSLERHQPNNGVHLPSPPLGDPSGDRPLYHVELDRPVLRRTALRALIGALYLTLAVIGIVAIAVHHVPLALISLALILATSIVAIARELFRSR